MGTSIHSRTHQIQQLCAVSKSYDVSLKELVNSPLSPESGDVALNQQDLSRAPLTKGLTENLEVRSNYK